MIDLFFSYSHKDEDLRDELEKHLSILKRNGIINTWHDRRIMAGNQLHDQIDTYLQKAKIILLLVSFDFLASDYCYDKEMQIALDRHRNGDAVVIPVILRPCDWIESPFGKLLAVPKDGKPVVKYASLDEGFLEVTNEIKRVTKNIADATAPEVSSIHRIGESKSISSVRSSNLRITKKFTDQEMDAFLDDAFEYIANFFEASLKELSIRNSEIKYNFKNVDALSFTAIIYLSGKKKSECGIYYGHESFSKGINYSRRLPISRNILNESLTVQSDGNTLSLKPTGMSLMNRVEGNFTFEGAAEYFWQILMEPLQRNY